MSVLPRIACGRSLPAGARLLAWQGRCDSVGPKKGDGCGVRDGRASAFCGGPVAPAAASASVRAAACGERSASEDGDGVT